MEKTWMPTTAGILSIIAGGSALIGGIVIASLSTTVAAMVAGEVTRSLESSVVLTPSFITAAVAVLAILLIIPGIVSVLGGIYALRRKVWGVALAGAVLAGFSCQLLGIPAIILVALSKDEFT